MKKFVFQFESVLDAMRQQVRLAETAMARQRQLLRVAEQRVALVDQAVQQACENFESALRAPASVTQYQQTDETIRSLQEQRNEAQREVAECRQHWFAAAERCRQLRAEVEGLCSLRDDARSAYRKDLEKQMQVELDEFVMRNWST